MTIDEVTLDRAKIGTGFSIIGWFCGLRLSRFALNFSTLQTTPNNARSFPAPNLDTLFGSLRVELWSQVEVVAQRK